jgi:hypothetical protein
MTNKELIKIIMAMDSWELLEWVISSPTDLTDSYYSDIGNAIQARYEELKLIRAG